MKIAIINDIHFGVRNSNKIFEDELRLFFHDIFFPYLEEHKIDNIIIAGDVFDDRRSINIKAMNFASEFFNELEIKDIETHIIPGNHDLYYKNLLNPNSIEPMTHKFKNIRYYENPTEVGFEDELILFVPWICDENEKICESVLKDTKAKIAITHIDVLGAQTSPGHYLEIGYPKKMFDHFKWVFNGHIHLKSYMDNVLNMGTQYQQSWTDNKDTKGFHVYDTETKRIEYIINPHELYYSFVYENDHIRDEPVLEWLENNVSKLSHKFIKVVLKGQNSSIIYDQFFKALDKIDTHDVKYIDGTFLESEDFEESVLNDTQKTTYNIIQDYIEGVPEKSLQNIDKKKLKSFVKSLYDETMTSRISE